MDKSQKKKIMSVSHIPFSEPHRFKDSQFETFMPLYRNVQASADTPHSSWLSLAVLQWNFAQ